MNKLLVFILLGLFMVSFTSAVSWDDKLSYENNDLKVKFSNSFLGLIRTSDIGTVELKSHKSVSHILKVAPGEDIVTMYYDFDFKEIYEDGLGDVEFVNMTDGRYINKDYNFVIWGTIEEEKNNYSTVCNDITNSTGTHNICQQVLVGTYIEEREGWIKFDNNDIPKGKVRIGLSTNVNTGETIDGIWTIAGMEIKKHAAWTSNLNIGLVSYYKLDNNLFTDSLGNFDGTNFGTTNTSGIIIDGREFDVTSHISAGGNSIVENESISVWFRTNESTDEQKLIMAHTNNGGAGTTGWGIGSNSAWGGMTLVIEGIGIGSPGIDISDGDWHLAVAIKNGDNYSLYIDGSTIANSTLNSSLGTFSTTTLIGVGSSSAITRFWNGTIDEIGIWNRTLTQLEITQLYNNGVGISHQETLVSITLNSPENNLVTVDNSLIFNATVNSTVLEIVSVSLLIDGVINETNSSGVIGDYIFEKSISLGNHNWSISVLDNETDINDGVTRDFEIISIIVLNQTFNNITTEGATEEFEINFIKNSDVQISTVSLVYNGTTTSFQYSVSGDNITSIGVITIPVVPSNVNVSFHWNITLTNGDSIITSTNNQTILSINVDDCSSFTNLIYNFTQYDEENQTILGGNNTIELQINLWDIRKTLLLASFSDEFIGINPVLFCSETSILETVNYSSYVVVKYFANNSIDSDDYSVEYYNILNQTIANMTIPINVALYNLKVDDTTKFRLTFRDGEFVLAPNILVQVHRQYIRDNDFKIVEIPLTDSNGQTVLNLVKDIIIYNFIMSNEAGEIVGVFNSIAAFCSDFSIGDCNINLAPDSLSEGIYDYNEEFDISISDPSYDNSTKLISMSFVTGDLTAKNVRMEIIRNNDFGNRSVCSDSLFAASGLLSCDVSSITDTDQFLFISTFVEDDLAKQDTTNLNADILNFGTLNGAFYAFIFILFIITMFMEDRKVLVVSLGLGWLGIISLGLLNGKFIGFTSAGIWILVTIGVFLWKLNEEELS